METSSLPNDFTLRPARAADAGFLAEMIVEAVNWRPDRPRRDRRELLALPEIAHYVADWPGPGDLGVIAEDGRGYRIGACWLRFFAASDPGYGFVATDIPEVSLAVTAERRGHGIGRALLRALAEAAQDEGIERLSLSVEPDNRALGLYRSEGYVEVRSDPGSVVLVKQLPPASEATSNLRP